LDNGSNRGANYCGSQYREEWIGLCGLTKGESDHLGELVRDGVADTLNAMLNADAVRLCQASPDKHAAQSDARPAVRRVAPLGIRVIGTLCMPPICRKDSIVRLR